LIDEIVQDEIRQLDPALKSALGTKSVLVTGGAGFIGSWLCDTLVSFQCSVMSLDNYSTGLKRNIDHLLREKNFTFDEVDISAALKTDLNKRYDVILHFASRASPEEYQLHPIETLLANSQGTQNMLELARRRDATVIFASTSEVYGDAEQIPTKESYWGNVSPNGPRSCYDEAKRYGEALCFAYLRQYDLDVRIVRIFNTYGPRIRADGAYGRVVSRFITQALKHYEMTVFGDGMQTRSFCYVTDTLKGILKIACTSKSKGEVINIGNPHEISVIELADEVKRLIGSRSQIVHKPLPKDDPRRRCPDVSKALQVLGWRPTVDLSDGLTRTIKWFKNVN
jgi:UDP-glucuronate decarboxylase